MSNKIKINQYYDWWFDNALEFLGHLLEEIDIDIEWNKGIAFDSLDEDQIALIVDNIERLIKFKLTYPKMKKDGTQEKANRAYLPTMHKGKYVNFLGKETKAKRDICGYLLSQEEKTGTRICDICGDNYNDIYSISQVRISKNLINHNLYIL